MDLDEDQIRDRIDAIYDILTFGYPSNVLTSILKIELDFLVSLLEHNAAKEAINA